MTAVLFQNMPPLSREEYEALETSIREHGIQVPIVVDENRVVIDGHHRQKIAQDLGIECPKRVVFDKTDAEKRTLALSLNLDRRHLSREQRRELIAESIKADPQLSNRQHAERTGVDHKTVGSVRTGLEESGEIPHFEKRLDPRTGKLSQPASRPRPSESELMAGAEWTPEPAPTIATREGVIIAEQHHVDARTGEILDDGPGPFNAEKVVADSIETARKITGMDDKTYTQQEAPKPRRRPLTDAASDAGWNLRKAIDRIERLTEDDRYNRNKNEVAAHLRGHLIHVIETCQGLLDQLPEQES